MTSASRRLNSRTSASLAATIDTNDCSSVTVPNRSSREPDSVPVELAEVADGVVERLPVAAEVGRADVEHVGQRPSALTPFGPSARDSSVAVRDRSSTPSGTAVRSTGMTAPSASSGPPDQAGVSCT